MAGGLVAHAPGGPEAMEWADLPTPEPGPGEVLVAHKAIGVNFIDVYFRTGLYPWPEGTMIPGAEASGTIEAVGADAAFAVERLGEDARYRGFAHAARTGKQVGVMQALVIQRIDQGTQHVFLTDHFSKFARPPFARQNLIAHELSAGCLQAAEQALRLPAKGSQYTSTAEIKRWPAPATPRRPSPLLRLLPSGPDRVHSLLSRGDRYGPPLPR